MIEMKTNFHFHFTAWVLLLWFQIMGVALFGGCSNDGNSESDADIDTDGDGDADGDADADSDTDADTDTDTDADTDADTDTDTETDTDSDANPEDVCRYSDPVNLGPMEADGMIRVPPGHPSINYFGRVDCTDKAAPSFAFPGISIRAKFTGTGIDMILKRFWR